jgi:hypothetical protein
LGNGRPYSSEASPYTRAGVPVGAYLEAADGDAFKQAAGFKFVGTLMVKIFNLLVFAVLQTQDLKNKKYDLGVKKPSKQFNRW